MLKPMQFSAPKMKLVPESLQKVMMFCACVRAYGRTGVRACVFAEYHLCEKTGHFTEPG